MIEVILMQRVDKLGQMGEVVKVRPGYARNFLLPQGKAIRANKDNLARFEQDRAKLEAQNLKRREEAERVAERVQGLSVTIIRSAGEGGNLYGSVSARDVAEACTASGLSIARQQVLLEQPIKNVGLTAVRVELHPEVVMPVTVNVAPSGSPPGYRTIGSLYGCRDTFRRLVPLVGRRQELALLASRAEAAPRIQAFIGVDSMRAFERPSCVSRAGCSPCSSWRSYPSA